MALQVDNSKPSGDLPGTPSRSKRDQSDSAQPSMKGKSKSKFAPFFDDKKREIEEPKIPEWRIYKSGSKPVKRSKNIQATGIQSLDEFFGGGIPKGLTIFVGEAGSGKSTLARKIAKSMKNVLYVVAEKCGDDPEAEHVTIMDYRAFLPSWPRALAEVLLVAEKINAEAIIIDSATRFFSGTNKAVEEADLRPALFELARKTETIIPVIAISEVRGNGWNLYPAGGQAVAHAPVLLVWFNKFVCRSEQSAERYGVSVGSKIWTVEVAKDSRNIAKSNAEFEVQYDKEDNLTLKEPEDQLRMLRGKKDGSQG